MKNMYQRAKFAMTGEDGASNLEAVVWIAVVLIVTVVLMKFGGQIGNFIFNAGADVDTLDSGRGVITPLPK